MGMVDMVMDLMVMEREMLSPVMDTDWLRSCRYCLPSIWWIQLYLQKHPGSFCIRIWWLRIRIWKRMLLCRPKPSILSWFLWITLTTLMERDLPSLVMDMVVMDMEVLTAASTSPD